MPTWALGALLSFVFVGATWLGIIAYRPLVHGRLHSEPRANDLIGFTLATCSVFYGLLLGLIAVAVLQTYSTIDNDVKHEAASLTSLYHRNPEYPMPVWAQLQDKGQKIIHAETLRELNHYVQLRRSQLASVAAAIHAVLWYVVAIGALLSIILICLFGMELQVHLVLDGSLSLLLGMGIFLIVAMDNPFRREVSISADALRSVYESLMEPS